ncbi:hypothetical protein, partial [Corynebacterium parakroppenstedtii]|uniref:hypothetical protein n=1 Tax=Corynebacterium parakroppenstedtii TaxID=2828363 RepID=UPI001F3891D3
MKVILFVSLMVIFINSAVYASADYKINIKNNTDYTLVVKKEDSHCLIKQPTSSITITAHSTKSVSFTDKNTLGGSCEDNAKWLKMSATLKDY